MKKVFRFLPVLFFLLASSAVGADAARAPTIGFRVGEHPSFDRIVFDAPPGARYKIDRQDERIAVTFFLAAKMTLRKPDLPRASSFEIVSGGDGSAPLIVRFVVAPGAMVKDFTSGNAIVIDVSGPVQTKQTEAERKETPKKEEKKGEEKKRQEAKETKETKETKGEAAPASVLVAPAPTIDAPKAEEKAVLAPTPASAPLKPVHSGGALAAPPRLLPPALPPETAKAILAIAREDKPSPVLSFDPGVSVGAAIFLRGGYVTILFDRRLSPPPFMSGAPQRVKADPIELPYNLGYRFAVPEGVDVRATREGTAWKVFLIPAGISPGVSTDFVPQPDFALGARLLLPTADPPQPIFYTDPVVGDLLLVLPLRETGAFTIGRRLADFEIIPAVQGLVIKPWHERVVARAVPDGIEITSEGGLKLSPPRDTGLFKQAAGKGKESYKVLFNFMQWRGADFTETRQKLMRTIIDVPEEQKLLARLDLARFYFAHGMGKESLALINEIAKAVPEIENEADFLALRGAARILSDDPEKGAADLSNPVLANQPEATLWQGIAAAMLRDWTSASERFHLTASLLDSYPEPFRSRFTVLAVEAALAAGKDKEASEWLSKLEENGHDPAFDQAVFYLRGVLYAKANRADMAGKLWRQATQGRDRMYKVRAELALVDLGVATKSITPKQAVDRLEGLRFAWRGDSMEFDILRRLAGFYVDAKEFRTGLLVYGQALRLYPTSPEAAALKGQMKALFKNIFLSGEADKLSPPEALDLYNNYRALVPDAQDANKIRINLAERLVDIDLLDQAGSLLEEVMKNTDSSTERALVASRLAAIRLLDRQPASALALLDQSREDSATLPEEAQDDRILLRARALADIGKNDEAMNLLSDRDGSKAKVLMADIAVRAKKWELASRTLLSLIGAPPADGASFDDEKAGWAVSVALALAQAGDEEGLRRLAAAYESAMAGTKKADLFRLLTHPDSGAQVRDIAAAQARLSDVDTFKNFLSAYRKGVSP